MRNLQGIIFDMDGLIFDTEMLYYQATQIVADEMGFPYDKAFYLTYLGVSDEEVWAAYHQHFDQMFGVETVDRFIQASFDKTVEMFQKGEAQLKPGVWELLTFLDKKELPRVIASSNQRKIIDTLLENAGLTQEFSTIICFDDVTRAKPDPEIFIKAQQFLMAPKQELLIFEDSQNGIYAAHAAEIPVIMVPDLIQPTPELLPKIHHVLPSLSAAPEYLQENFCFK